MIDPNQYEDLDESLLIDDSFTASFAFDTKFWVCLHDYIPDFIFSTRDQSFYSFKNKQIYSHNQENFGKFYNGIVFPSYITPTFKPATESEDRHYAFILDGINFNCDFYADDNDLTERSLYHTFSSISFHNSYQSSAEHTLVTISDSCSLKEQWKTLNIRRVRNSWFYNKIRDETAVESLSTVIEKFDEEIKNVIKVNCAKKRRLFVDDFIIVKLKYDNANQMAMQFSQINFDITLVKR